MRRALTAVECTRIGGARSVIGRRAGRQVVLVQAGIGRTRAGQIAQGVLAETRIDLVMSTGFACALAPARIGDVVLATEVMTLELPGTRGRPVCAAGALHPLVSAAADRMGLAVLAGRVVSLPRVLWRGQEKRDVARAGGAVAADMESAALGEVAASHGLPFMVIRTVSDLEEEDLPLDFNLFLTDGGRLRGVAAALRPSALFGLLRLRRQSRVAANHLSGVLSQFLDLLRDCAPPEGSTHERA